MIPPASSKCARWEKKLTFKCFLIFFLRHVNKSGIFFTKSISVRVGKICKKCLIRKKIWLVKFFYIFLFFLRHSWKTPVGIRGPKNIALECCPNTKKHARFQSKLLICEGKPFKFYFSFIVVECAYHSIYCRTPPRIGLRGFQWHLDTKWRAWF